MHFLLIASCRLSYKYLNIFDYLSLALFILCVAENLTILEVRLYNAGTWRHMRPGPKRLIQGYTCKVFVTQHPGYMVFSQSDKIPCK